MESVFVLFGGSLIFANMTFTAGVPAIKTFEDGDPRISACMCLWLVYHQPTAVSGGSLSRKNSIGGCGGAHHSGGRAETGGAL